MKPKTAKMCSTRRIPYGGEKWDKPARSFRERRGARDRNDVRHDRPWKLLLVGNANRNRSKAAEAFCRAMIGSHHLDIEVASAGMMPDAISPVTSEMLHNADAIMAMDSYIVSALAAEHGLEPSRIICLHIPDIYGREDRELKLVLEANLGRYLLVLDRVSRDRRGFHTTDAARMSRGTAQAS